MGKAKRAWGMVCPFSEACSVNPHIHLPAHQKSNLVYEALSHARTLATRADHQSVLLNASVQRARRICSRANANVMHTCDDPVIALLFMKNAGH